MKTYIAPQIEDVQMDTLMAEPTFLGVATVSSPQEVIGD